jgi:hypothetical protein
MLITLWIRQRENVYVEIDMWHCNIKKGEPLLINYDISGLKTCSIGNDHLNGAACIARLPSSGNNWMGMCCFPALFT